VLALLISFMPCFASKALIPAGIGLITGFIALVLAQKSDGRQGYGLPIAAMSVSAVAVLIGVGWLILGKQLEKAGDRMIADIEQQAAKEDAKRKAELEKAAKEVQTASPEGVIRVTAQAFYQASADDDDGDRFDRMYKNKVIEITGVFHEVNLTGEDGFVVLLKGGPDRFDTVPCRFAKNPDTRAKLTQLQPGQTVTIRGKCLGDGPVLEACILVN
jgi:hypothetical protein